MRFSDSGVASRTLARFSGKSSKAERNAFPRTAAAGITLDHVEITPRGAFLERGAISGHLEVGPVECSSFSWLVPWWNADTAGSGLLGFFVSVRGDNGWSRWYPLGEWGSVSRSVEAKDDWAYVDTDTLKIQAPASAWKLKVEFSAGADGTGAVSLSRVGVITREKPSPDPVCTIESANLHPRDVLVPSRSQLVEDPSIKGRICSPTCASMALQALGVDLPTRFVAADCYDAGARIYGNWPFNVASLWRLGARARLECFSGMDEALTALDRGFPFIASVRFGEGELSGSPVQKTSGHLILVRGLEKSPSGRWMVLVNDPAAPDASTVARSYLLEEFEHAWRGVAYVIEGRRKGATG